MTIIPIIGLICVIFFSGPKKDSSSTFPSKPSKSALTSQLHTHTPSTGEEAVLFAQVEEKLHQDVPPRVMSSPKNQSSHPIAAKKSEVSPPKHKENPKPTEFPKAQPPFPVDTGDYEAILTYINTNYPKTTPNDAEEISRHLVTYGQEHQIDPKLVAALIARESGFNKKAVSSSGALGLGQIKSFNFNHLKINDPFDIKENVQGTVTYMTHLMDIWKDKSEKVQLALASYYKGPTAIKNTEGEVDMQTKSYVSDILKSYDSISKMKDGIASKSH